MDSGYTASQLIKEGYKKSSVHHIVRELKKNRKQDSPTSPIDSELQGLRRQKEAVKLRNEISELENARENLSNRVTTLEKELRELRSLMVNAVDTALFKSLVYSGMDPDEAREFANGWVDRNIKG